MTSNELQKVPEKARDMDLVLTLIQSDGANGSKIVARQILFSRDLKTPLINKMSLTNDYCMTLIHVSLVHIIRVILDEHGAKVEIVR